MFYDNTDNLVQAMLSQTFHSWSVFFSCFIVVLDQIDKSPTKLGDQQQAFQFLVSSCVVSLSSAAGRCAHLYRMSPQMFRFNVPVVDVTTLNIILMLDNLLAWFVRDASKYTSLYLLSRYVISNKNNEKILHLYLSKIMLGSFYLQVYILSSETFSTLSIVHFLHFQPSLMFPVRMVLFCWPSV